MASETILRAHWDFDAGLVGQSLDSAANICDVFHGHWEFLPGVGGGRGLRFDGFTTWIERPAGQLLKLGSSATIEAWVALGAFPWNDCPIVDASNESTGLMLGVDDHGRAVAKARFGKAWLELRSPSLGLQQWHHLAMTVESAEGLTLYLDGKRVGHVASIEPFREAAKPALILGRTRAATKATRAIRPASHGASMIYLDGIADEIKIHAGAMSAKMVKASYAANAAQIPTVALPPRNFPESPKGRFGAFYTRLNYYDAWDRRWRVSDHPDVVVRFDDADYRFVFWRGTNYVPCWATANGIWYTNEFNETWGNGIIGCGEPMSDKHCAYSHVRIIESNDARAVVHWRYALVDVYGNRPRKDPVTGWTDFTDELYTIYPDGTGTRKITLHSTQPLEAHEFQETMVVMQPGQTPEDVWDAKAITMANMAGEEHVYDWTGGAPKAIDKPDFANIQRVNIKSPTKPFFVVSPGPCLTRRQVRSDRPVFPVYAHEIRPGATFPWWNHWPTAEIPSDGRHAVAADRASHASVSSGMEWEDYEVTATSRTRVMLHGLTALAAKDLVPLAASWLTPPVLTMIGGDALSHGYDVTQRAYVLSVASPDVREVALRIDASHGSPLHNLCLVINGWEDSCAQISIDGQDRPHSKHCRIGHRDRAEARDLIVWLALEASVPKTITIKKRDI